MRDMAADVMKIMTVIGFLIALAVVGLTLFTDHPRQAPRVRRGQGARCRAGPARHHRSRPGRVVGRAWPLFAVAVALVLGAAIGALLPMSPS